MKRSISLRLRVTLACACLLTLCCILLTLTNNYYAYEMATAIEATPLEPALSVNSPPFSELSAAITVSQPARQVFRTQSVAAMCIMIAAGCLVIFWITGKALAPLQNLDQQIRKRTAADLDRPLPVPGSRDEVSRLTEAFNLMSQNLNMAFQQQKRFSQCAAHELRTPLAILKTRIGLFRKKGLYDVDQVSDLLDVLEEQTDRLSLVVGDLLALTNMDEVDCGESIPLDSLLSHVVQELEPLAQTQGITITLQGAPGTVRGNRPLLERAFFNLVENAIHYNRPNGTVTIRILPEDGMLTADITDQGPGIAPHLREQIFEPFFRVDKSRSRQLGGAGLGLALVHAIVELHHGQIHVEDAPQQGSRFVVMLPSVDP